MIKTFNEWLKIEDSNEMQTLYDEDLVTQQVNDWLTKLIGLCSAVPMEDRPEMVEQIVKSVRHQLLSN